MFVLRKIGSICSLCTVVLVLVFLARRTPRRRIQSEFCFKPNVLESELSGNADEERVTLVLHATFDRVGTKLIPQVDNWEGPISLAVVFPEEDDETTKNRVFCSAQKLKALRESNRNVTQRLSVHFVIPTSSRICVDDGEIASAAGECRTSQRVLSEDEAIEALVRYPINVARNLARKMVHSRYTLIADLDHLFSVDFESKMAQLARSSFAENPKLALVYRIFEVDHDVARFPRTKADLKALFDVKRASVFHHEWHGHHIRGLDEWFATEEHDAASIQFVQEYNVTDWEPQFVSESSTIPEHDESFFYPAADNTVLRWEMCRSGFEFAVVNDVFMFHHGRKSGNERKLVDNARFRVKEETLAAKNVFRKRMSEKFPESSGKCGF